MFIVVGLLYIIHMTPFHAKVTLRDKQKDTIHKRCGNKLITHSMAWMSTVNENGRVKMAQRNKRIFITEYGLVNCCALRLASLASRLQSWIWLDIPLNHSSG